MKKNLLFVAAAAFAALTACSKNEPVAPAGDAETEISYVVAPKVKSGDYKEFDKSWYFHSFAYYLPEGYSWAAGSASATAYLYGSQIEWDSTVWRNKGTKYYWPKKGGLTFFAWAFLNESISYTNPGDADYGKSSFNNGSVMSATFDVNPSEGIKFIDYNVVEDKNLDVLVADIVADQNHNTVSGETGYMFREGVPTLFRHKLSKVVFTATTKEDYGEDVVFTINSIKFNNLAIKGTYVQGTNPSSCVGGWTPQEPTDEADKVQTYYSSDTDPFTVPNGSTKYEIYSPDGQYFYLPQTFDANDTFTVDYNITIKADNSGVGTTTDIIEQHVTQVCALKAAEGDSIFDKFEIGKKYTINLVFGLEEILWDPATEDWEDAGSSEVEID